MNDRIKELQKEIERERQRMNTCSHAWGEVYSNPEIVKEEYLTGEYTGGGVDRWPVVEYRDKTKQRWSRKCIHCGFEEHTYTKRAVISSYEADFS